MAVMLKAKVTVGNFKKIVGAVASVLDDVNFLATAQGIRVKTTNATNTFLINVALSKHAFANYKCTANLVLGVRLSSLFKIIKSANAASMMELVYEKDALCLSLTIHPSNSARTDSYEMRLVDVAQDDDELPDMEYKYIYDIPTKTLQEIFKRFKVFGRNVNITCDGEELTFTNADDDGFTTATTRIQCLSLDEALER